MLKATGSKILKKLNAFAHNFLRDPSIFFDLPEAEWNGEKLDEALAFFKIEKS